MRIGILSLLALSVVAASTPAWAWWSFAKWGMTEAQLIAASEGVAKSCSEDEKGFCKPSNSDGALVPRSFIRRTPIIGEETYVVFLFDGAGALKMTRIAFWRTDFNTIAETLTGTYGPPFESRRGEFASGTWRDPSKGTLIKVQNVVNVTVNVTYEAIRSGL